MASFYTAFWAAEPAQLEAWLDALKNGGRTPPKTSARSHIGSRRLGSPTEVKKGRW